MKALNEYFEITVEAIQLLSDSRWEQEREEGISRLGTILDRRQELQEEICPPFKEDEKELGQKCVQLNEKLSQLMNKRKQELGRDLQQLKQQKQHNDKYANPYDAVMTDGVFYDKRK